MIWLDNFLKKDGRLSVGGAPEGFDALIVAEAVRRAGRILHVARDDARMAALADALAFFAPEIETVPFPAWDCLPYDRVSPNSTVTGARMTALGRLARATAGGGTGTPLALLTTVNALLQRVPARDVVAQASLRVAVGEVVDLDALYRFLARNGYLRVESVMEPGEYAVRGGIIDVFPAGAAEPVRLDLFGDHLESVRRFDPLSQRTTGTSDALALISAGEVMLDEASIARFRSGYRESFGAVTREDPLYGAVSEGRKHAGMEHWLPLFHERLETLFDYLPAAPVSLDHLAAEARDARLETIRDHYEARREMAERRPAESDVPYRPLAPERLYLSADEWDRHLSQRPVASFSPFLPDAAAPDTVDAGGRAGRDFAAERARPDVNEFDALREHIARLQGLGKRVLIATFSAGTRERVLRVLADHHVGQLEMAESWPAARGHPDEAVVLVLLGLEHGFETADLAVIGEQDLLGDRYVRSRRRRSRLAENFIARASELETGDLVVHVEHGIGRYEGLRAIEVTGAPHDCVMLIYDGGDRLFVPVENIELLSRYGSGDGGATLDRLGGAAWQARKARLKKRIREIADQLIAVAATRATKRAAVIAPPEGLYQEFSARFPHAETDDQERAIGDTIADLASGHPMDRLVCGDVGFGKTEVALRCAFAAVMAGKQVAVVTPTTLLCRQHFNTFRERFAGLPVRIEQLSRFVIGKRASEVRRGLTDGTVDIVIGTHALLGKRIAFADLGLLVIDEEQHFGVLHKERLKQLRSDVHVLTLTATPIPRTLQLALSGVREMSLIATPPVDRLAVRTFVMPFDAMIVREAILREHYRGGQTFYVCPRIEDLPKVAREVRELVPEVKLAVAHGQMPAKQLDQVMNAFYDGAYDVLLSTSIIDSGLDIPTANTLIVHRADMFGLAQLYQLRGRVGRSKVRAYAYLTLPPGRLVTPGAEKRLKALQALDTLGAGFTLASHDLDIRGAGNLLGEEQSGHIREVGLELYQQMLEEAVAAARGSTGGPGDDETWSPQITLGTAVLIPEAYVADLGIRLELYRRMAGLNNRAEVDGFAAELIDRFGPLPDEVEHLLEILVIKGYCRRAGVARLEAGPRGATLSFRDNRFANPAGLVDFISRQAGTARLRPDHTLLYLRDWPKDAERLLGVRHLVENLAEVAAQASADADADAEAAASSAASLSASSNT